MKIFNTILHMMSNSQRFRSFLEHFRFVKALKALPYTRSNGFLDNSTIESDYPKALTRIASKWSFLRNFYEIK